MMLWLLIGLVLLLVALAIYAYNKMVVLRMRAMQAWADIDVQLQRVAELISNLVNTLKGSAIFEKKTLESIARAHAELVEAMRKGNQDQKVKAASNFMGVLMPIIYQIPQYPQLKTTETFRQLMDELSESMDKIAYARQFYNQAVAEYNTFIALFPWNIFASLFKFSPLPFFEMPERERVMRRLTTGEYTKDLTNL